MYKIWLDPLKRTIRGTVIFSNKFILHYNFHVSLPFKVVNNSVTDSQSKFSLVFQNCMLIYFIKYWISFFKIQMSFRRLYANSNVKNWRPLFEFWNIPCLLKMWNKVENHFYLYTLNLSDAAFQMENEKCLYSLIASINCLLSWTLHFQSIVIRSLIMINNNKNIVYSIFLWLQPLSFNFLSSL